MVDLATLIVVFTFYYCVITILITIIPSKDEVNELKCDKTLDYEKLNSKQKRLCLKRLRLRKKYLNICKELQVVNNDLNKELNNR